MKERNQERSPVKEFLGTLLPTVLPFAGLFLGIAVMWLSVSPFALNRLVGGAQSPEALLQGYCNWYRVIVAGVVTAVLLPVAGSVASAKKGIRSLSAVTLIVMCIGFPVFLGAALTVRENVPGLIAQAREDLIQIKTGYLQKVTVWLSPKSRPARLPGPYGEGQPKPVTRYGGVGTDTEGTWVEFYVPDCLRFSLDQAALYNENESVGWNMENARQYRLYYTEHFHLVVSVEPVGMPGDNAEEIVPPGREAQR